MGWLNSYREVARSEKYVKKWDRGPNSFDTMFLYLTFLSYKKSIDVIFCSRGEKKIRTIVSNIHYN